MDKTGDIMSKLAETNLLINTLDVFNDSGLVSGEAVKETAKAVALLDIAKSLAIIADNTSIIVEHFKEEKANG
jgi:16S rRNA G966 N2-methylase RsmD